MDQPETTVELTRSQRMLRSALGPLPLARLDDPGVAELVVNPDGRVWLDRFGSGLVNAELSGASADAERILRLVAHHVDAEIHAGRPRLSAELPGTGERFEGLMPPLVAAPAFSIIRKVLYVGFFAFLIGNFHTLSTIVLESFHLTARNFQEAPGAPSVGKSDIVTRCDELSVDC